MTRDEAAKKWANGTNINVSNSYFHVDGLAALGLIKFDEEVTAFQVIHRNLDFYEGSARCANRIYNDLKEKGFL